MLVPGQLLEAPFPWNSRNLLVSIYAVVCKSWAIRVCLAWYLELLLKPFATSKTLPCAVLPNKVGAALCNLKISALNSSFHFSIIPK